MVKCAVSSCRNRPGPADPKLLRGPPRRFFRFPEDPERVQVWLAALRETDDLDPAQLSICEDHFLPQDVTPHGVRGDAVPITPHAVDTMDSWMFEEEYEWDLGSDGVEGGGERRQPAAVNPGTELPDKEQIKKSSPKKRRRTKAGDDQREPLAKRLLEKLLEAPDYTLDLCHMTVALETHRNRLWEVSTVMEGINLVEKVARNQIRWLGRGSSEKLNDLQKEVTDLRTMEETLDRLLAHFSQQLLLLTNDRVNAALAYVTMEDLCGLEAFQRQTVMVVKAPDKTRMKVRAAPEDHIQVHLKGSGGPTEVLTSDFGTGATAAEGSGCFFTLEESRIQTSALLTDCRDSSEAAHTPPEDPPSPAEEPREPVMTERRGQSPEQEAVDQVCPSPDPPELQQRLLSSIKTAAPVQTNIPAVVVCASLEEPCDAELGVSRPSSSQGEQVVSSVQAEVCTRPLSPQDHKGDENLDYSTDSAESHDGFDEPGADSGGGASSVNEGQRQRPPALSSLSAQLPLRRSTNTLMEDVQLLHHFLQRRSAAAAEDLFSQETPHAYAELARVTLAQVVFFNRRHGEDISRMTLESFMDRNKNSALRDIVYSLSQFEQRLAKHLSVVEIVPRRHREALLLQPEVVSAAILLKDRREKCHVHQDNPFLFGRPHCPANSFYCGDDCVRVFAQKCGAKNPDSLTAIELRRHIATACQVLSLESDELEELGGELGLSLRADRDFYRQGEASGELDWICRMILAKDKPAAVNAARWRRNVPKLRWSREEEAAVMKHFGEHIRRGLYPLMSLCQDCKDQEPALEDRTASNIQAFVKSRSPMWRNRRSTEGQT